MKGIVFNLLELAVVAEHGDDGWDDLLDSASLDGAYTAVGTYPHADLHTLLTALADVRQATADDTARWFGRSSVPLLVERYPAFFEKHQSARSFILTLNEVIHPEVRKLFRGAYAPEFDFEHLPDGVLELGYRSDRGLCTFAEGLVQGTAAWFGETADVVQTACARSGGERCVIRCKFTAHDA